MSKTALKREISGMTDQQLRQIILDAYCANKEIKEYFDYFIAPDPQAKHDEFVKNLLREFSRRRGPRASLIKNLLKKLIQFNPGPELELSARFIILRAYIFQARHVYMSTAIDKLVLDTIDTILAQADHQGILGQVEQHYAQLHNDTLGNPYARPVKGHFLPKLKEYGIDTSPYIHTK